jgi:hypothetical protein
MEQNELDILRHLHTLQTMELNYRRNREFQIFTWSATILIAIIGALLIRAQGSSTLFTNHGAYWKIVAGLVVTGLTFFSAKWQLEQRKFSAELQRVLASIGTSLAALIPRRSEELNRFTQLGGGNGWRRGWRWVGVAQRV